MRMIHNVLIDNHMQREQCLKRDGSTKRADIWDQHSDFLYHCREMNQLYAHM